MNRFLRGAASACAVLIITFSPLSAEGARIVDFLGIASPDADSNMIRMTENLYYTQLGEIQGITVVDKRAADFSQKFLAAGKPDFPASSSRFAFYAVIKKSPGDSGKWTCTLTIADRTSGESHSYAKDYDSYYKILLESKSSLQSVFMGLLLPGQTEVASDAPQEDVQQPSAEVPVSTDSIAGTWTGEDTIDKIILLRGGRGFIIFKNGASMNITVLIDALKKKITVTQAGKSNASFFPELERKTALEAAVSAAPVRWELSIADQDTLTGNKTTLVQSGDAAEEGTLPVKWTRKEHF